MKVNLQTKKYRLGFTLLELLVVISIIAILIGLTSVSFSTAQKKGRNSKRRGDMKSVQNAFEQYYALNNAYAANCTTMATGSLATGLPVDPKNTAPYTYTFTCSSTSAYCICADLESETGNSTDAGCTYASSGNRPYFCLSNLQ